MAGQDFPGMITLLKDFHNDQQLVGDPDKLILDILKVSIAGKQLEQLTGQYQAAQLQQRLKSAAAGAAKKK